MKNQFFQNQYHSRRVGFNPPATIVQLILLPLNTIKALFSQAPTERENGIIDSKPVLINISRNKKIIFTLEKAKNYFEKTKTNLFKKSISSLYASFEDYPCLLWSAFNQEQILLSEIPSIYKFDTTVLKALFINISIQSKICNFPVPWGYFSIFFTTRQQQKIYKLIL